MEKKVTANKPAKKAASAKPNKKQSGVAKFFKRIGNGISKFFKGVWGEVKKLSWPTPKELVSYTLTVLAFIVLMSIIIGALDFAFGQGFTLLGNIPKLTPTPTPVP